ncbi:DNA repair protein RecN [Bacillus alkalicellulosilyticus]|uniref:DNA repair protein RecN n=1 Tax=Alkalihalobacterium alkalicellulosilyticum TaxID=1912214 RepID=UPI000998E6BA|nr:DNA repair protein RecN [Bacillus alkalicellulosilyticus]
MLLELSIKNFAIIEKLTIPFEKGLTVFTGETGAGKSIIIDAIGLLVGGRGSSEFVRYGTNRAEIEGLFSVNLSHPIVEKTRDLGIDVEDDMLVLRRDITANGKSVCRINGKLVTLGILREIGQSLIDIHGQHEHQVLMQPEHHLSLLDAMAKEKLEQTLVEYRELYTRFNRISKKLKNLLENDQELAHRLDLLQYQSQEIEKANLEPGEDERLLEEKHKLVNGERLFKAIQDGYNSLYGDGKALDWVSQAQSYVEEAADIDSSLQSIQETVANCFYLLEEAAFSLRNEAEGTEFEPGRIDIVESRLNEITQLKRKYGSTVAEILDYAVKIDEEQQALLHKDDRIQDLEAEQKEVLKDLVVEAQALSAIRKQAADKLMNAVHQELKELYMDKTKFEIAWRENQSEKHQGLEINGEYFRFSDRGIDQIEFLLSTNPGEPLKPLAKVASGGEISRIMLAMKTIFSASQGVTSLIFDEVDTGVSGRVAQAIAEKILEISFNSQVFCITHLPQVAAMADHHLYISKSEENKRTYTKVEPLSDVKKVEEIARMISGVEMTELTKEHAKELLQQAQKIKTNT